MLNLGHVFAALSAYETTGREPRLDAVHIDSRQVQPRGLFVAFRGEQVDGHDFVGDAIARGALAALVERPVPDVPLLDLRSGTAPTAVPNRPVALLVNDTTAALQALAAHYRQQFDVRTIGITGSVGKTTTKEVAHRVLSRRYRTLKSEASRNNEIGLPLTLLQLRAEHERAVLEMGTYGKGEIATLCAVARPVVGVVTMIGQVHLERMGTVGNIVDAKSELVEALPADGVAILNLDDERVMSMAGRTPATVFTYGLDPRADLWAGDIASRGLEGIRLTLHFQGDHLTVNVPLLGRHSVHTVLRAAAIGLVEGLRWDDIIAGLQEEQSQLRLVAVEGPRESLIIDDTYNASPASVIAALNLLSDLDGRRIAVLGDMLELGSAEESGHRLVGRRALAVADLLIAVGARGRIIGEEALAAGMGPDAVLFAADAAATIALLGERIEPRDVILVKGSRALGLEQVVNELGKVA